MRSYLRLILGISLNKRILSIDEQNRLGLAEKLVAFVGKNMPRKQSMSGFIREYASENGVSQSFCYKVKAKLEYLTIIKFDQYWEEYRLNMERYKRDKKALSAFKRQVDEWKGQ